ncbi:unnamed protein product [Cylicocyclus nassatus]|uniref:GST C-terminal domain-containing protein n=1 Tax=Cylicocyclus nassatus TaxID=53992 RepID=A0AA36GTQ9_CYLNA|nr:unnamed protein product [Cylicocyclus nassatus]
MRKIAAPNRLPSCSPASSTMVLWATIALASVAFIVYKIFFSEKKGKPEIQKKDWKKDTVYLYQFPRAKALPNLSPFCLKIETFLKANKIPYEACPVLMGRSQYGLLPFVELNGEHIADSQIIMDRLAKHFSVKQLDNPKDRAIARAIDRMADNHTFLVQYQYKLIDNDNGFFETAFRDAGFPEAILPIIMPPIGYLMRRKASQRIAGGIGKLSDENYKDLLRKDYDTYQTLLGQQKFMFGDEISAADCTLFGQLATTVYLPINCYAKDVLKEEYPALVQYCDRIRETVFGKEFTSD